MARIFIDGFESGSMDLWDQNYVLSGSKSVVTTPVIVNTYCLSIPSGSGYLKKYLPGDPEYYLAYKFRFHAFPVHWSVMGGFWDVSDIYQVSWGISNAGQVKVYKGQFGYGTLLASGPNLTYDKNYLIEIHVVVSQTVGVFQMKVDSILVIDLSAIDTMGSVGVANINYLAIGSADYASTVTTVSFGQYIDDVIVDDAAWVGNTKIQAIWPTGVGNSSQWTPLAGSNYANVDEIPYSDADYISTNTVNMVDTYVYSDLLDTPSAILCVQPQARIILEGTPTPLNLSVVTRISGSDYVSSVYLPPTTNYQSRYHNWPLSPATTAQWGVAEVNNAEFGIKSIT